MTNTPDGAFSLNAVYDQVRQAGRLHGMVHDGEWFHIHNPESITETERLLRPVSVGMEKN